MVKPMTICEHVSIFFLHFFQSEKTLLKHIWPLFYSNICFSATRGHSEKLTYCVLKNGSKIEMSHIAERDVAIKIQFPASGARYMQISVLRGNICVGEMGGLFLREDQI